MGANNDLQHTICISLGLELEKKLKKERKTRQRQMKKLSIGLKQET